MNSMKKKVIAVLTAIMLVGSMNMVLAGSDSASHEFIGGCVAYYDAYCMDEYGSASTWMYVSSNVTNVNVYVSMQLYITEGGGIYGTDADYSSTINSGLATADAEVPCTNYTGFKVKSEHSAGLGGLPSDECELLATNY